MAMNNYTPHLKWIETQQQEMLRLLFQWGNQNTFSYNLPGLSQFLLTLKSAFSVLQGTMQEHSLAPQTKRNAKGVLETVELGKALSIFKRPNAKWKLFFGGHMDTVYSPSHHFQKVEKIDDNHVRGPGVADLKGGLIIMLKALEAFERSPFAEYLGWEILINPDEEIGSPGSTPLLQRAAKRNQLGLLFEPSFSDGALVSSRKGSATYTIEVRGKAAHAGRDFHLGQNAIYALADLLTQIEKINHTATGTTINVGFIEGGGAVNIVPDFALCRLNIRTQTLAEEQNTQAQLHALIAAKTKSAGMPVELHEETHRPPKPFDATTEKLFEDFKEAAAPLGISLQWRASGGVCDGNTLAAAGLPNIDTLGAVGGNIHTPDEYIVVSSLKERAQLVALYLMQLAEKVKP